MNIDADMSPVIFSKDLPQSSFVTKTSSRPLSAGNFPIAPPRTLFDEIGREFNEQENVSFNDNRTQQFAIDSEFSWKSLVRRLREENTSLLSTVQSTKDELSQAIIDKTRLEDIVTKQEASIQSLQDQLDQFLSRREENPAAATDRQDAIDQYQETDYDGLNGVQYHQHHEQEQTDHARLNNLLERKAQLIEQRDAIFTTIRSAGAI
ncbi:hypothetical protein BDB00DRAFT_252418 [Zychaea mexicana]|uniref:uncharacterized protein n=1 Tax=Zychaea mexicana TaxID=64656 RepID=UPI0022FE6BEE|nr:uncharacterized protein BDB00DRAFT_252418 [Zychaea mexicana]KAI9470424.1 hypothetical protein BDB00DRAFT_252418 [Zychaea mexicana]